MTQLEIRRVYHPDPTRQLKALLLLLSRDGSPPQAEAPRLLQPAVIETESEGNTDDDSRR